MANLLLHSLSEFRDVILGLIDRLQPKSVLEIGSETGRFTEELVARCTRPGHELITIEPFPAAPLLDLARDSDSFHLFQGLSLAYLTTQPVRSDFLLIDGDHNYFTLYNELRLIAAGWQDAAIEEGVMLLHDVNFPWGRRDCYYDPTRIPAPFLQPHSFELGVTLGSNSAIRGGFRGEGSFAVALHEGGPRNGVRTAIEDFCKEQPRFVYRSIDCVFGLGALTLAGSRADSAVAEAFAPYDNALVRRLERNRLELYLKVLELQDLFAAQTKPVMAAAGGPTLQLVGASK